MLQETKGLKTPNKFIGKNIKPFTLALMIAISAAVYGCTQSSDTPDPNPNPSPTKTERAIDYWRPPIGR